MTHLRALWFGGAVFCALGCGGNAVTEGGSGGTSASGGSASGGAETTGGASTGATDGTGASASGGSATGGTATGGTSAGGVAGGENTGGAGASAGYSSCTDHSDCVVVPESCCGDCGAASRGDAISVHEDQTSSYRTNACDGFGACLPCYTPPDPTLVGSCSGGLCEVVDLNALPLTACTTNEDCHLRAQACCECDADTGPSSLIAIRLDARTDYASLMCPPEAICPECEPIYPNEATAVCSTEGRCQVDWN